MRYALVLLAAFGVAGCRVEKVGAGDTTSRGAEPGPGMLSCGISRESRVAEDGLGLLRIGALMESVRDGCTVISEEPGVAEQPSVMRVNLGEDTAKVEFVNGLLRRITLYHQAYRTADSLGVGTHASRLQGLSDAVGLTENNRLYALSPSICGLRFMFSDPAPAPPAAQKGREALRRIAGEARARELEIVGCAR